VKFSIVASRCKYMTILKHIFNKPFLQNVKLSKIACFIILKVG